MWIALSHLLVKGPVWKMWKQSDATENELKNFFCSLFSWVIKLMNETNERVKEEDRKREYSWWRFILVTAQQLTQGDVSKWVPRGVVTFDICYNVTGGKKVVVTLGIISLWCSWLGNTSISPFTLSLRVKGEQRFKLDEGKWSRLTHGWPIVSKCIKAREQRVRVREKETKCTKITEKSKGRAKRFQWLREKRKFSLCLDKLTLAEGWGW